MSKLPEEHKFIDLSDYGRPFAKVIAHALKNTLFTPIHLTIGFIIAGLFAIYCIVLGHYWLAACRWRISTCKTKAIVYRSLPRFGCRYSLKCAILSCYRIYHQYTHLDLHWCILRSATTRHPVQLLLCDFEKSIWWRYHKQGLWKQNPDCPSRRKTKACEYSFWDV